MKKRQQRAGEQRQTSPTSPTVDPSDEIRFEANR